MMSMMWPPFSLALLLGSLMSSMMVKAKPNVIIMQPDDLQFFEEWTPPAHFSSSRRFLKRGGGGMMMGNKRNQTTKKRTRGGKKKKNRGGKKNRSSTGTRQRKRSGSDPVVTFPTYLPNMERLRIQGLQMLQGYTASPKCGTSRYSTLTGRYPSRSSYSRLQNEGKEVSTVTIPMTKLDDIGTVEDGNDCSVHNLAATMKDNGYRTGVVGKWHLSKTNSGSSYSDIQDEIRSCGFDYAEAIYPENLKSGWNQGDTSHNMEYVTHKAIEFINESDDEPFLLYLNPTVPHGSGSVYDVLNGSHKCTDTPEGPVEDFTIPSMMGSHDNCEDYRQSVLARSPDSKSNNDLGSIWIDDAIGAILYALKEKGQLDNTLFLFQMDHGQEGKGGLDEPGVRIAQFIHYPDMFGPGTTFSGMVSTIDIAATVLDYSGIEAYDMDGKSWKDAIGSKNEEKKWEEDRCLVFELGEHRAVRCGCYKYHSETDSLYDLCDGQGNYITAADEGAEAPEQVPITNIVEEQRLKAYLECHRASTDPNIPPIYDEGLCEYWMSAGR